MITYGNFINAVLNFTIVAFAIFMMVKALNSMKKAEAAAKAQPTTALKTVTVTAQPPVARANARRAAMAAATAEVAAKTGRRGGGPRSRC